MLEDALRFPLKGDRSLRRLLAGGLLMLVPLPIILVGTFVSFTVLVVGIGLALLMSIVLYGYLVAVLRASGSAKPTPPPFAGWGRLLVDGVLSLGVWLVYLLPGILTIGAYAVWLRLSGSTPDSGSTASTLFLGVLLVTFGLIVAGYYLAPAALANYVHRGKVRAAFDVRTVAAAATTKEYLIGWGLAVVVYMTIGSLASFLQFLLVGFFAYFYVLVVMTYLCGRGFADALDSESVS